MKAFLKITAAGATIFAIGLGMTVLQPEVDEPVASAEADIAAFSFGPKSQQQRFIDTLMQEGMEEPRAYDHNGNKMFFSTASTEETPRQVLERFQRGFVDNGVNDKVHLSPMSGIDTELFLDANRTKNLPELTRQVSNTETSFSQIDDYFGGVVPMMVDDTRVIMAGATTENRADDWADYIREAGAKAKDTPQGKFDPSMTVDAMRYVEAYKEGSKTRILAVWSDEDYEMGKFIDKGEDLNVDPNLPACPGCKRLYNVEGETESDYSTSAFTGAGRSVDQVVAFYDTVLRDKGWQLSPTAHVIEAAEQSGMKQRTDGKMLQYTRGAEFLTLVAWPDEDGATVHLSKSN